MQAKEEQTTNQIRGMKLLANTLFLRSNFFLSIQRIGVWIIMIKSKVKICEQGLELR